MPSYPESGIKLVVETTDALSAIGELQSQLDDIQSGDYSVTVTADADTSEAQSALEDLPLSDETVDFTVDVTQTGDELPPDGETIDTTIDTTVKPADDNSQGVLDTLISIKRNQQFRMLLDIAGTAVDFFKSVSGFAVQPMLDLDTALARIKATTGETIPNADKLINGIFYNDLGESIDQVAALVTQAHQLKAPIDESVTSALQFTKVFTDKNPEDVLNTLNQLVLTGLEPNFKQAGDDLVTAFQNGGNKGGDLLDTIRDNATAIHDLGLSGPQALTLVTNGLNAGFNSADSVLKTLERIKTNVQTASGNSTSDVTKTLNTLGIANPVDTGKAWSSDFFKSVIEGIQNAPVSDNEKQVMFQNLVGGKLSAKEFSSFMKLSPEDAAGIFENTQGAAATAAQAIDDSLGGAIKDFELAAQKAAVDFLSSDQIDLPGKIAALKSGLQDGLTALQGGSDLGQALTIALKPLGFDDEFQGLESALGNFVIAILQAVSFLQSLDPSNWGAKAGTDAVIAKQGATQLAFDLKIANPDDITSDISTAISRGVTPEDFAKSVGTAVNELIKNGQPALAQSLLDSVKTAQTDMVNNPTVSLGRVVEVKPYINDDTIAGLQKQITDSIKVGPEATIPPDVQQSVLDLQNAFDTTVTSTDATKASVDAANTATAIQATNTATVATNATKAALPLTNQATDTTKVGTAAATAAPKLNNAGDQLNYVTVQADTATIALTGVAGSLDVIINKAGAVGNAADTLAKKNTTTTAPPATDANSKPGLGHASGSSDASGTFMAGEGGREIISTNKSLAVLNNMTTEAILNALQGYIPGGRGGSSSHVSNTINNTNIIPSEAVADSLGYRQAATLRGMN